MNPAQKAGNTLEVKEWTLNELYDGFCDCPFPCQCNVRTYRNRALCIDCQAGRHMNCRGELVSWQRLGGISYSMGLYGIDIREARRREILTAEREAAATPEGDVLH